MAGQTLPAAKGAALGVFLWSTVSLLALGGASLLALGAGELAHAFHARRPHPAVARPVPNLRRR